MVIPIRHILAALTALTTLAGAATVPAHTHTAVFNEAVRTLRVGTLGGPRGQTGIPVAVTDNGGFVISFDHLSEDREYLRYTLTHCTADWTPDQLSYVEYLDGFNEGTIDDYDFSRATTVHYVHYTLTLPNEQTRPTISGNYLLRVYPESDPEDIWLQCRLAVSEGSAVLGAEITTRTDVDYNRKHQQLSVNANVHGAAVTDSYNDLILVIEQNGRTDDVRTLRHPLRISGDNIFYEHTPELIFNAGNEYRRFETISTQFAGMNVDEVAYSAPYYRMVLMTDKPRSADSYHYDETLGGGYVVREYNSDDDSDVAADYTVVYFSLDMPQMPGMDIYIDGDMVQRRFTDEARVGYDTDTGRYTKAMLLKQGAYSYQYLAVPAGTRTGRTDIVEGDKYETRNTYRMRLYNRRPGARYDALVGAAEITLR